MKAPDEKHGTFSQKHGRSDRIIGCYYTQLGKAYLRSNLDNKSTLFVENNNNILHRKEEEKKKDTQEGKTREAENWNESNSLAATNDETRINETVKHETRSQQSPLERS